MSTITGISTSSTNSDTIPQLSPEDKPPELVGPTNAESIVTGLPELTPVPSISGLKGECRPQIGNHSLPIPPNPIDVSASFSSLAPPPLSAAARLSDRDSSPNAIPDTSTASATSTVTHSVTPKATTTSPLLGTATITPIPPPDNVHRKDRKGPTTFQEVTPTSNQAASHSDSGSTYSIRMLEKGLSQAGVGSVSNKDVDVGVNENEGSYRNDHIDRKDMYDNVVNGEDGDDISTGSTSSISSDMLLSSASSTASSSTTASSTWSTPGHSGHFSHVPSPSPSSSFQRDHEATFIHPSTITSSASSKSERMLEGVGRVASRVFGFDLLPATADIRTGGNLSYIMEIQAANNNSSNISNCSQNANARDTGALRGCKNAVSSASSDPSTSSIPPHRPSRPRREIRVCVVDVARGFTIDATHSSDGLSKISPTSTNTESTVDTTSQSNVHNSDSHSDGSDTNSSSSSNNRKSGNGSVNADAGNGIQYPHDAAEILTTLLDLTTTANHDNDNSLDSDNNTNKHECNRTMVTGCNTETYIPPEQSKRNKVLSEFMSNLKFDIKVTAVHTAYLTPDARKAVGILRRLSKDFDVFVNLYDLSDETGQKIVDFFEKEGIAFTGAGSKFYDPPRKDLKSVCWSVGVNTPPHAIIEDVSQITDALVAELGGFNVTYADVPTTPISLSTLSASLPPTRIPIGGGLFVKPEHGYDSVGIDEGSRVFNMQQLKERCAKIISTFGGALVEKFVSGREFSVLVVGNRHNHYVFPPVEYIFPKNRQPNPPLTFSSHTSSAPTSSPSSSALLPSADSAPSLPANGPSFITFEDKWGTVYEHRWSLVNCGNDTALTNATITPAGPYTSMASTNTSTLPHLSTEGASDQVDLPRYISMRGDVPMTTFIDSDLSDSHNNNTANTATHDRTSSTNHPLNTSSDTKSSDIHHINNIVPMSQESDGKLARELMEMARQVYIGFNGAGLARFDIRQENSDGVCYVLDVNPNCSLFYKDECTADTMLRLIGWKKEMLMLLLLDHALLRKEEYLLENKMKVKYTHGLGCSVHATRDIEQGELIYTCEAKNLRLATRSYISRNWSKDELRDFDAYAWPIGGLLTEGGGYNYGNNGAKNATGNPMNTCNDTMIAYMNSKAIPGTNGSSDGSSDDNRSRSNDTKDMTSSPPTPMNTSVNSNINTDMTVFALWSEDPSVWRPINHCCDPNAWMYGLSTYARRKIKKDEEITLDYATFCFVPPFECWCGSSNCRKTLKPAEWREAWFHQRYGHGYNYSPFIHSLRVRTQIEDQLKQQVKYYKEKAEQKRNEEEEKEKSGREGMEGQEGKEGVECRRNISKSPLDGQLNTSTPFVPPVSSTPTTLPHSTVLPTPSPDEPHVVPATCPLSLVEGASPSPPSTPLQSHNANRDGSLESSVASNALSSQPLLSSSPTVSPLPVNSLSFFSGIITGVSITLFTLFVASRRG